MKKYNNKLLAIGFSIIGIVILTIIGLSYAFFTAGVIGNENANQTVIETADLRLVFNDTDILDLDNALPGVSNSKTFTVTNIGTARQRYDINITNVINTFINDELVYTITSDNEDGGEVLETSMPTEESTLLTSSIDPGVTITYEITVKFKETGSSQDYNQGATFSGKLQIVPRIMGVALGGYVYDESDNPLSNVIVELNSDPIITITDSTGYYEIADAPIGNHTLYIKQGETVLGSKEVTLLSSAESEIKVNSTIYLPDKIQKYLNIKLENELNIFLSEKSLVLKWAKNFGGSKNDHFLLVTSSSDGYVAVGYSLSTDGDLTGLNKGGTDASIVKYDLNGNVVWKKNYGGSDTDIFQSVTSSSDGYVAVGYSLSTDGDSTGLNKGAHDAIIVKYDLNGNVVWKKNYGGSKTDYFASVTSSSDGYVAVGYSLSTDGDSTGLNKGVDDAIIVKYDLNGNVVWKKNYGGITTDRFFSVTSVSDGYVAVGHSNSSGGDLTSLNKGDYDAIIVKYDLNGNVVWKKNYGGSATEYFNSVTSVSDGYVAAGYGSSTDGDLTGLNKGARDAIIVKYDLNGNVVWKKNYGGSKAEYFLSVTSSSDGYVAVGYSLSTDGDSTGLNKGVDDAIIVKYDKDGNVVWKKNYGGSVADYFISVSLVLDGCVAVGYSLSTDGDLTGLNKGETDAIIFMLGY